MKKTTRNMLIAFVIILLIFALISVFYQHFKTKPIDTSNIKANIVENPDMGFENMINTVLDDEIEKENTENENNNNNEIEKEKNDQEENKVTSKENKAINLVKEQWKNDFGSLEGVSFSASIQSNGKYGVTVYDTKTTQSIQFYIVDVETETVKER